MRRPRGWWQSKSTPAKVETYTRLSYHFFTVMEIGFFGLPLLALPGLPGAGWVILLVSVHALLCSLTTARGLDWVRGRRERPVGLMWALSTVSLLIAGIALTLTKNISDDDARGGLSAVTAAVLIFGVGAITIALHNRRHTVYLVTGCTAVVLVVALALGVSAPSVGAATAGTLVGGMFAAAASHFSVWLLNVVFELDAARETRARLAVTEERLRFGRDLHDVLGRNLAVIALKSELAVQLARRERPEAVEQMIEVQSIARESQREVRDVVRGYREAELGVELAGAKGVLAAAGIACEVRGEALAGGLPGGVQSALAWVVREATTNVLRHGDAKLCSVGLLAREGRVVLTVENDGVRAVSGARTGGAGLRKDAGSEGGGSGLAGLRERLSAVEGTLEAGPVGKESFRLVAEVPLETPVASGANEVVA
ncbi:sensor histidine kinase [Streptomyces sp. NPDC088387]|uniref:sensor histidine kinase n=1 Tax=Streptomyces sp. NPDC088387 TaxID=3365859 RepID=UPI0037FB2772